MPQHWPWKRIGIAALLLAEVLGLSLVAWSAASGPIFGVAVPARVARISMSDQHDVVHAVTVNSVVTPVPGWLIVQADWNDGVPEAVLGSRWVHAGESRAISISLDPRAPLPRRIYVTLLADLGKPHVLEYFVTPGLGSGGMQAMGSTLGTAGVTQLAATKDKPMVSGGTVVTAHVTVSALSFAVGPGQAVLADATRTADATALVISRVVAPAQSWISVSYGSDSNGELLGTKLVSAGVHNDVRIPLKAPPGTGPITATLHVDLGTLGQFDYSPSDLGNSPDQPYVVGGQPVSVPVQQTN